MAELKKKKKKVTKNKKLISNIPVTNQREKVEGIVYYQDNITVNELASKLKVNSAEIIKFLFMTNNQMATINTSLDDETVELVALQFDVEVEKEVINEEFEFENFEIVDDEKDLIERPPVITIMGHVDHGKTTLLDTIRNTNVVTGEFGGITQHIGAYQISFKGKKLTFLDTPGHEAFTAMRARGAQVTDIVIIVVAADDGVMPQTREAIDHAKAANVPIIVAVNKIDKPGANPEKVMSELAELDLMPEIWGGDTVYQEVSAKQNVNIDSLLDTICIMTELLELKANPNRYAMGTVIESKLDKARGVMTTLLVQNGTLRVGDPIVVGSTFGKIRFMTNDLGQEIKTALPSTPVEIMGLNEVPVAGDKFMVFESEKQARSMGVKRNEVTIEKNRLSSSALSLDDLYSKIHDDSIKEINVIVKADVQGSAEVVKAQIEKITVEGASVKVIRSTVGTITESDILLAAASNAMIYGFNVRPTADVKRKADEQGVEIRLHNVIYKIIEELEHAMLGILDPEFEEVVTGQAQIRQTFKVSKVGTIAGAYVTDGSIVRDSGIRLIRDGIVIYEGKLSTLKRFKDDVKEVKAGFECGFTIENYNDIKEDDVVEGFVMREIKRVK